MNINKYWFSIVHFEISSINQIVSLTTFIIQKKTVDDEFAIK